MTVILKHDTIIFRLTILTKGGRAVEHLLKGVYKRTDSKGKDRFVASFTYKSKHISLGSFATAKNANYAYKEALELVSDKNNKSIDDYECTMKLSFEKWITIINFRDNGLYIKNPIYLRRKFFEYYLSPSEVMKFSAEDLFYYSHHKIIRRGRHFFVADYGMQVNIMHRYGIRSFAVAGKDYIFLNGDNLDFRYENLEIINRYIGVRLEKQFPKPLYIVKIHIKGSVIVGRYGDETTAAIAYNKAAHLLIESGFKRKYELNYIDSLNTAKYENIFKDVRLSKSFLRLISSLHS